MKRLIAAALAASLAGGPVVAAEYVMKETAGLIQGMPADVVDLIERADSCAHFMGEPPFSKQREADLKRVIKELRCERMNTEIGALARKHSGSPSVQKVLKRVKEVYL